MSQVIAIIVLLAGLFLAVGTSQPKRVPEGINHKRR